MAGEKAGINLLVKVEIVAGSGNYETIGGLQTKEFNLERANIETTNHGSAQWQEFLQSAGVRKLSLSGSGVYNTAASLATLRDACMNGTNVNCQFIDDNGSGTPIVTYSGAFKVPSFTWSGEHTAEQKWAASFMSNGAVTVS
jgi:TP901-1 family phage major tail protein